MRRFRTSTFFFAAYLLCFAPLWSRGEARMSKQFYNGEIRPVKIAVIDPEVTAQRSKVTGGEQLFKESAEIEDVLKLYITQTLLEKGYKVVDSAFKPEAIAENQELGYLLSDIQGKFDELHARIAQRPKDVTYDQYSMGGEIAFLDKLHEVDAYVFIRGMALSTSGGKKALTILMSLGQYIPGSGVDVRVTFVEAKTGLVIAYVPFVAIGPIVKKTEKVLDKPIRRAFKGFPTP